MQTDFFGLSIKLSCKLIWTGRNFGFRKRLTEPPSVFHEGNLFNDVEWDKMPSLIMASVKKSYVLRRYYKKIP